MRNEDRRFKVIHKEGNSLGHVMEILVDKETGVHYLFAQSGYAGGLTMLLDSQGIAVRSGSHCAIPLHARLGLSGSVRVSPAFYNTAEEIDVLAAALARVLDSARKGGVLKDKANG